MATLQIRKETSKVWRHVPSDELPYIVSKLYIKSEGENIRVVELGGSQRGIYNFADVSVYDIGGIAETFTSASELMQRLEALGYIGFFYEGEVSPSTLISADLGNIIELGSDGKLYAIGGGSSTWGSITGTLSDQTDLQNALDSKVDKVTSAGVERVYTINTDGSQGTKATSEFKDVIEGYFNGTNFYTDSGFTNLITPESSKIYVALDTNLQYRWSGSAYVQIGSNVKNIVTNTSVTGTFNLDANLTDTYVLTLTGNTTLALINFSPTIAQQMTIYITGNFALTYPAGAKVFGSYSTTKTNQLVLEKVGSATYITINNYV